MKWYIVIILILLATAAFFYFKKNDNMKESEALNEVLKKNGLPATYVWDEPVFLKQSKMPGTPIVDAFTKAVPALFTHSEKCTGRDDFYSLVKDAPDQFNLGGAIGDEQIKKTLIETLSKDKDFRIYLLPADSVTETAEGVKLFPPEEGESTNEYWIWYIKVGFFPGPAWLLIKRDGTEEPFHYGYI